MTAVGFLSHYLYDPLLYIQHHITINVLSASLNTNFLPSFISTTCMKRMVYSAHFNFVFSVVLGIMLWHLTLENGQLYPLSTGLNIMKKVL